MNQTKLQNHSTQILQTNEPNTRLLWAAKNTEDALFAKFNNTYHGYEPEVVETMRKQYGENKITPQKKNSYIQQLIQAFINPFTIVLFILAAVSLITDVIIAAPGEGDPVAVIIIITMVTISGLLRFVQESRSGKAAEHLSAMVETTIAVKRKQTDRIELPIRELVVGDIVYLAAGDMVPADLRILQSKDLFISQSALTGESDPCEKSAEKESSAVTSPLDCHNLAFTGSNVISGAATAIVILIGDETIFGSMVHEITGKKPLTSFEKGVNSVSFILIRFMLIMVPIVLFVNGFTKGDWLQAFLFSLSVAVGLTPEMLPMLVSANLARGAVSMSKHQVIVKDLNAIQNLGAMDILCSDKTGTLTQDKVVLMHSLDIHGKEDERVLRHAFINSSHQTGLKNLMDIAVIHYATEHALSETWNGYQKVDEIPFDFSRRRMSVVVSKEGKTQLITKGAVEEMLSICSFVEYQGVIKPITEAIKTEILQTVGTYNTDGLRVLAVAQKSNPSPIDTFSVADESEMVLMGYLAFLDPPKDSTLSSIQALHEYGVDVKILTGDNASVTRCICRQVGIDAEHLLLGSEIEEQTDEQLCDLVEHVSVFAKLSPAQKARVVGILRKNGHTVGFMGDGINDAAAMKAADVGISVDSAVDIAKETANIILLEKDLMVLERGVIEGRKTYANIIKYIKMTASSNFGNMFSVLVASAFLPFLPMLPIQILALNLIYDISCLTIPWDNVDAEYLKKPRQWNATSISSFMLWIGPASSVFDITLYLLMYFFICPMMLGGNYQSLGQTAQIAFMMLFQSGWFVESLWSQTLVIHMIRSPKIPFIQSRASWQLTLLTSCGILIGTMIPFTKLGNLLGMVRLPGIYFPCLLGIILCYMTLVTILKNIFIKKYGELL
ncbi:MAG: magnesium-translocating P-type ATPase [Lachnospiraceae bacterium]